MPFLGAVSDLFGRQAVLLFSVTMFTVGTIISCLATDFVQLLCGRTIEGMGGGGIYTLSYIVVSDIIPLRQRPKYLSLIVAGWALGTVIGRPCSRARAVAVDLLHQFPFCALGFLTGLRRVDWLGSILFIAVISSFLIGLAWGDGLLLSNTI